MLDTVLNNDAVNIVTLVVALASAIAAATPTPKEGTLRSKIYKVIDFLALNILKAKQTGK